MYNISKKEIKELAEQLAQGMFDGNTTELLEKTRTLYEKVILLYYADTQEEAGEKPVVKPAEQVATPPSQKEEKTSEETPSSVHERIQQIVDNTPKIEKNPEHPVEKDFPTINPTEETAKGTPTVSLEEELQDAISAELATDLFEKAETIEITKKSLNEKFSQEQIQIGLNDRIAFVKHLFNGSQTDFNRTLSQLNSFQTEEEAKTFLNTVIKPDYNWSEKPEFEERFLALIERKFL